jgi:hypothetical protein
MNNNEDILRTCTHPDLEIDELIAMARSGRLKRSYGGPIGELRRHRAHRLQQADNILKSSLAESRGITSGENCKITQFLCEAEELNGVISELESRQRKDSEDAVLVYDPMAGGRIY